MQDLVIKNGIVVDGTGNPWYRGSVTVSDGKIVSIGTKAPDSERVIDAMGQVVAPGFIDTHSHSDLMIISEPEACQKIMQGVTTETIGQDGLGEAPIRDDLVNDWRKYLSGLNGDPDIEWDWRSFGEYLDKIEVAGPATNILALVGHGNLRLLSMGLENRKPSEKELEEMRNLLATSMAEGAFGMSTGLIYPPCVYADTKELIALCKVVSGKGGLLVTHMRNEADMLLQSIEEVKTVGLESGAPVHVSHFKTSGERNWGKAEEALKSIEAGRAEGVDMTVDQYPYTAGSTFLSSLLPTWIHDGGVEMMLTRLKIGEVRKKVVDDMLNTGRGKTWGWGKILVTSMKTEKNKPHEGKTLEEIAVARGQDLFETLFDLILQEENAATMVSFSMSEDDVRTIMRSPLQMVCTDGIVLGKPHPRVYGSFPRVLGRYVREGVIRLEEAIRKMTALPAQRFGLHDRGLLKPGMCADITIFDPNEIADTATYEDPIQFPRGIRYVIVNGNVTVDAGEYTGGRSGRVLRHL